MSEIQLLSDLVLGGALVLGKNESEFPLNPRIGTFVIKDQCLYGYIKVGGLETWYPFASKTNSYIHTQGLPAYTWVVNHGLGTADVWFQVRDLDGNILSVGKEDVDDATFKLYFTSPVVGTVVVVAPDSINVPQIKASDLNVANGAVLIDSSGIRVNGQYVLTSASIAQQLLDSITAHINLVDPHAQYLQKSGGQLQGNIDFHATQTWPTWNQDTSGNAATASKLSTARLINGMPFDGTADITILAQDVTPRVASSEKGAANGVATLGSDGKVPSAQLPSYVDDVVEYSTLAVFPALGEQAKIYVDLSTNKTYRWSGSAYVQITSGAVDSVAGKTGVVSLAKADVGLGNVDNTSDLDKPISTATRTALDDKEASGTAATAMYAHTSATDPHPQYVLDGDARLADARPASDVSAWAKEATKPSYTASEVSAVAATGGTASGLTLNDGYTEEVFAVTGATPALSPANGSIQTWTLTGNSAPTLGAWASGQSITLLIDDGAAYSINWTSMGVVWKTNGGTAPVLLTTGYTALALVSVGGKVYGWKAGDA